VQDPLPARPDQVVVRRVHLPLVHEHRAAHGREAIRDVVLVEVVDAEGRSGWGECPTLSDPTYTAEYTAGAWRLLVDRLAPALLAEREDPVVGHGSARWAIETAVADLRGQAARCSLADTWAGPGGARGRVASTAVVSADDIDDLCARVAAALELGHRSVKVKIAPGWDLEPLGAIRSSWPDLDLAADANGSLPAGDARRFDAIEALDLAYLEQPLAADDLVGSAALAARLRTPIVLDESVGSSATVATLVSLAAADGVNAKPGRLGREAIAVARAAHEAGLEVVCGGMLETGVGRAAALAVAALPACTLPSDLGPSRSYFATDLTEPFVLDDQGMLDVPEGPGLGLVPDRARLAAVTVDEVVLRAER
jgi:O-succinylbenzoate synthase